MDSTDGDLDRRSQAQGMDQQKYVQEKSEEQGARRKRTFQLTKVVDKNKRGQNEASSFKIRMMIMNVGSGCYTSTSTTTINKHTRKQHITKGDRKKRVSQDVINNEKPDIVLFQELQWNYCYPNVYSIEQQDDSGICILYNKNKIKVVKEVGHYSGLDNIQKTHKLAMLDFFPLNRACICEMEMVKAPGNRFVIISWHGRYKPPAHGKKGGRLPIVEQKKYFEKLMQILMELYDKLKIPILIGGDFNINIGDITDEMKKHKPFVLKEYEPSSRRQSAGNKDYFIYTEDWELPECEYVNLHQATRVICPELLFDHDPVIATAIFKKSVNSEEKGPTSFHRHSVRHTVSDLKSLATTSHDMHMKGQAGRGKPSLLLPKYFEDSGTSLVKDDGVMGIRNAVDTFQNCSTPVPATKTWLNKHQPSGRIYEDDPILAAVNPTHRLTYKNPADLYISSSPPSSSGSTISLNKQVTNEETIEALKCRENDLLKNITESSPYIEWLQTGPFKKPQLVADTARKQRPEEEISVSADSSKGLRNTNNCSSITSIDSATEDMIGPDISDAHVMEVTRTSSNGASGNPYRQCIQFPSESTLIIGTWLLRSIKKSDFGVDVNIIAFPEMNIEKVSNILRSFNLYRYENVIIYTGGNDVANRHDLKSLFKLFKHTISEVQKRQCHVYLCNVAPRKDADVIPLNSMIVQVCKEMAASLIDVHTAFKYGNGTILWKFYHEDGIHLNNYGTRLLVRVINNAVTKK